MDIDEEFLQQLWRSKTDEQIIEAANHPDEYSSPAIDIIRNELVKRGLSELSLNQKNKRRSSKLGNRSIINILLISIVILLFLFKIASFVSNRYMNAVTSTDSESSAKNDNPKSQSEIIIPRSVSGDKGKYFLLEKKRNGNIVRALHKRVGVDSIGYTLTETNCVTMRMREIGYSEESPTAIKENPSKWFDLVPGSSKSDIANFICQKDQGKSERTAPKANNDNETKEMVWVETGKDAIKNRLKDPDSAQFKDVYFFRGKDNIPVTCGQVNSKNSYGGYSGFQHFISGGSPELTFLETEVQDFAKAWNSFCTK
jgi:hypothetical protein